MDELDDAVGAIDEDIVVATTISAALQRDAEQALTEELDAKGAKYRRRPGRAGRDRRPMAPSRR